MTALGPFPDIIVPAKVQASLWLNSMSINKYPVLTSKLQS